MSVRRRVLASGRVVWEVRWLDGVHKRSRAFSRKRDADSFDADLRRRKRLGDLDLLDAGRQTLHDFAREWWKVYADPSLSLKTRSVYAGLWDRHILPRLGGMEMRTITPEVVERFAGDLQAAGLSDAGARKVLALLQTVLQRAVAWRRLNANPVAAIRKPRVTRTAAVRPPSPATVERLRSAILARRRLGGATLVSVLAYAGLRPGEALALRWRDIGVRTILVERAVSLGQIKSTKTGRIRSVRLLGPLADDLAVWRELSDGDGDSLVFPNRRGEVWSDAGYRNWRTRVFDVGCADARVEIARPYDLRHAFVSLLLAEGRSVVFVAGQAGHAPTMTLDIYGHVIDELELGERRSAEVIIRQARGEMGRTRDAREGQGHAVAGVDSAGMQGLPESPLWGLNPGPPPYHGGALPLS